MLKKNVLVKVTNRSDVNYEADSCDTIKKLKDYVFKKIKPSVDVREIKLIYKNKVLEENQKLFDLENIENHFIIGYLDIYPPPPIMLTVCVVTFNMAPNNSNDINNNYTHVTNGNNNNSTRITQGNNENIVSSSVRTDQRNNSISDNVAMSNDVDNAAHTMDLGNSEDGGSGGQRSITSSTRNDSRNMNDITTEISFLNILPVSNRLARRRSIFTVSETEELRSTVIPLFEFLRDLSHLGTGHNQQNEQESTQENQNSAGGTNEDIDNNEEDPNSPHRSDYDTENDGFNLLVLQEEVDYTSENPGQENNSAPNETVSNDQNIRQRGTNEEEEGETDSSCTADFESGNDGISVAAKQNQSSQTSEGYFLTDDERAELEDLATIYHKSFSEIYSVYLKCDKDMKKTKLVLMSMSEP